MLAKRPHDKIRIYAVWFNMLWTDSRAAWDASELSDRRVQNYWDDGKLAGIWFARNVTHQQGVCWDAFFAYGPRARWTDVPAPLQVYGSPVVRHADLLQRVL